MDTPWDVNYRDHALWNSIEAAQQALSEVDMPISDPRSVALQELLTTVGSHKDSPDILITQASLDAAAANLSTLVEALPEKIDSVFAGSPSLFEKIAATVRTWPATASVKLTGLSQRVDELNRIFAASEGAIIARVDETIDDEKSKLATKMSEMASDVAEYKAQMSARREQDTESADTIRDSLSEALERLSGEVSEFDESVTELKGRISTQDKRLDDAISERADKFAAEKADRNSEWESIKSDMYANIAESKEVMDRAEEESRNILATTGTNVTAGDYGAYATEQGNTADRWRRAATLAFIAAGVIFVFFAIIPLFRDGLQLEWWEYAFQRLGTPAGIAGVAIYMARESGLHRKQQREAKQAHLTLSALEPFIANLPPREQSAIRSETARKLFANANSFKAGSEDRRSSRVSLVSGSGSDG